jgi:hypothetical protein
MGLAVVAARKALVDAEATSGLNDAPFDVQQRNLVGRRAHATLARKHGQVATV